MPIDSLLNIRLVSDAPLPSRKFWSVDDHLCPPEEGGLTARSPRRPSVASPPKPIAPSLATLVDQPPSGTRWLHEIKWDGYRLIAYALALRHHVHLAQLRNNPLGLFLFRGIVVLLR